METENLKATVVYELTPELRDLLLKLKVFRFLPDRIKMIALTENDRIALTDMGEILTQRTPNTMTVNFWTDVELPA